MKTVLEYLEERREMAGHNLFCYSATYAMDTPKEGYEKKFREAVRDCEIVDELIAMVRGHGGDVTAPVDAEEMISKFDARLRGQIRDRRHYPGVNPETARHELYGYMVAIRDLGHLSDSKCFVLETRFDDELTAMIEAKETPAEQTPQCETPSIGAPHASKAIEARDCYFSQKMKGKERKRSEINGIKLNNMQKSTPKKRA